MKFKSHTYKIEDHLSADAVIEQMAETLDAEGYDYLSGPAFHSDADGALFVTMVFRQRPDDGRNKKRHSDDEPRKERVATVL